MISEFEKYHGAVLRGIVVGSGSAQIACCDRGGRTNCFSINGRTGLHIKHSTSRLPPWLFTYNQPQIDELDHVVTQCGALWLAHVCGDDGVMALSYDEFRSINPPDLPTTKFIRVDKSRNTMYRVFGTGGELSRRKDRGVRAIVAAVRNPA
jgi:hypothetical protein